ncbi:hypothetical protein Nepgr_020276 [Nepenthes gracilis]|uniref:Uncharacterized protein n=1 Tax=Nepenthes gracilis TaxID=150966 RepID=A0AAD3XW43_NEPGR|nr:hypothetical protein Nepgr_020276 [Nepenthes gracilis]
MSAGLVCRFGRVACTLHPGGLRRRGMVPPTQWRVYSCSRSFPPPLRSGGPDLQLSEAVPLPVYCSTMRHAADRPRSVTMPLLKPPRVGLNFPEAFVRSWLGRSTRSAGLASPLPWGPQPQPQSRGAPCVFQPGLQSVQQCAVGNLDLSVGLRVRHGRMDQFDAEVTAVFRKAFSCELGFVIGHHNLRNPKAANNALAEELRRILFGDLGERHSFHPFGKVVDANDQEFSLPGSQR